MVCFSLIWLAESVVGQGDFERVLKSTTVLTYHHEIWASVELGSAQLSVVPLEFFIKHYSQWDPKFQTSTTLRMFGVSRREPLCVAGRGGTAVAAFPVRPP